MSKLEKFLEKEYLKNPDGFILILESKLKKEKKQNIILNLLTMGLNGLPYKKITLEDYYSDLVSLGYNEYPLIIHFKKDNNQINYKMINYALNEK